LAPAARAPSISRRSSLARRSGSVFPKPAALEHATNALSLLNAAKPTADPFDSAIMGRNLDLDYVEREAGALGFSGG
jgi:hypothetical protein